MKNLNNLNPQPLDFANMLFHNQIAIKPEEIHIIQISTISRALCIMCFTRDMEGLVFLNSLHYGGQGILLNALH